jgi:hypothetical protein
MQWKIKSVFFHTLAFSKMTLNKIRCLGLFTVLLGIVLLDGALLGVETLGNMASLLKKNIFFVSDVTEN